MQSGMRISFLVPWIAFVLLCLVYTYFLFLSLSVIARCFVSFILVQFFSLHLCLCYSFVYKEEEEEERTVRIGGDFGFFCSVFAQP